MEIHRARTSHGFSFSQIGKEDECINANKSYFFYNYTYPIDGLSKEISNQYSRTAMS